MNQRVNHFPFSTSEEDHFKVIEKYFTERGPVYHQFESYEFLVNHGLQRIIDECNSIEITTKTTSGANASTVKHNLYKATFGQTYWEKASVTDENRVILHLTPNEARLRDITYDSPIFVDIKEEFWEDGVKVNQINHPKVFLLRMPTMVGSSKCNLYGKTIPECIALGECENDPRGYFIVNGKERALICQERLCHSHVYVFENNSDKYVAEMRSMSEETGHSVLIKAVIDKDFRNCCFSLPYMSKEVLAGAVFKALGFSNEEILQLIQPSSVQETKMAKRLIRDSIVFQTREDAILYISKSSIQKVEDSEEHRIHYTTQVIENELFPHMGISTSLEKGIFLGTMINKLFRVSTGARSFDDRDNVSIKRIEGPGMLLGDLFRMCLKRYCDNLKKYLEKRQDIITAISRTNSITQAIRAPMCFVKGTLVSLSNGTSVPIEQLETLGANVLGWNKETCLLEPSTQTHFFNQGKRDTIVLTFEDGRKIQCTPEHKLLVFQNEKPSWMEASTIPNGCDVICGKKYPDLSTSLVKLVDIRKGESEIVYDITVENTHSFLANGIVSSNCTGNWAAQKNTYVRTGVSQIMSRLTYPATISHLRRIVIPIGKEGKNVKVRQIHPTQSFFIDIIESPEGKGIGIIKNFALLSKLTVGCNPILVRRFIEQSRHIKSTDQFLTMTRPNLVLLNGVLVGLADNIDECYQEFRRLKFDEHIFSDQVSFIMDREEREIRIFCDAGRFMRPLINVVPNDDEKNDTGAPLTIALRKEHVVKSWMDLLESGVILYVDSNEVENSLIAMYPSDLIEHSSQPYNYCEIHPSTMLGVCSSVIPYGEHNQCIYKDEPVYLADGTTKPICKVKVGDKVITFDPETQKNTIAAVSHIHAAKTEKKVYKVTTINHRSITATFDHPFMTSEGWKHVEDIKLNSTKVAISLEPKPVSVDVEHFLVLDEDMFREKCDGYNTKCNFSSFNLPLYSTSPFVIIIARLFGYCSSIDKDLLVNSLVFSLTFDSQYSMELFMYDIGQLGLTSEKPNVDKSKNKITYHGLVPLLLISLGITDEKLPYWITNGSDMVKREFLAGLQNDTNCKSLYDYFETKPIDEIVDNKQLINYVDMIGFRYNVTRQAKFGSIVEYMRHSQTISYEEWKKSTEVKLSTIFLPIISKEISLENEICDITIDSPNQSFICGDNFCVHNCPRLVYESSMMKQALGVYALSYKNRYDTISHVMAYPQKALVDTKYNKMLHYDEMLTGINPIVAIMCYTGFNQEDSVILNKASVDRGMFVTTAYRTLTYEEKKKTNCSFEKIEIPPLSCQSKAMNYSKLAKNGIVHKGVPVYKGDVIVGKTLTKVQKEEQEEKIDCSLSISSGEEGIIDEIWVGKTEEGYMMVKVKIRQLRIPEVGDKMACFTDNTSVLTTNGWKSIKDVSVNDSVATLKNDEIVYEKPSSVFEYDYDGQMYNLVSQQLDMTVTPNHKLYVKKRDHSEFDLYRADKIFGKRVSHKKNGEWKASNQEVFTLGNYNEFPEVSYLLKDWCYFLGIWYAEGWVTLKSKKTGVVSISVNKKRVLTKLTEVLQNMNIIFTYNEREEKIHIYNQQLFQHFKPQSVGAPHKTLPDYVWDFSKEECRYLLEGMLLGDGSKCKNSISWSYWTSSKKLAEDVQRLALHCGWSANMILPEGRKAGNTTTMLDGRIISTNFDNYRVAIVTKKNEPTVNHGHIHQQKIQKEEWIDFKGKVYCIEVSSHVFYVKQNGKPYWSGNSRSSQKGVCGLLLEQENMPFTQQGITPDLLMNAHCFTAETQISLCNGLSKPISKMFVQGGEHVWTHNKVNKEEGDSGIVVSVNKSMGCGGVKKIVKLTMEDGRTIRCTPNHKFYTKDGEWIEAQDMVLGTTQLQMSIEGVEDVVSETEYEIEQKWEFAEFNMKTNENREKSMAFARILGYLLTDGCICESRQRYSCPISFGHKMDAELCKQDIYLLTGISPKICENDSDYGNVYIVNLPSCLVEIIIRLDGITIGRRTQQITTWPSFIFNSPLCFVREFLAGLFGGDGHAPYIKGEHVNEIRFCQTSNMEYEESFTQKMQLLCDLLNRFDVNACIERTRYYHKDTHGKTKPLPVEPFDKKDYMATVYIIVKDTLAFTEKIGMRYCLEKMCRLSLYKSYKLLQQRVKDQSEAVFGLVNKYMNEKKSTEKSIELARAEFFANNVNLNNYYTFGISGKTQVGNRRKPNRSSDVLHLSYKHFPTFKQYIENLGCSEWYSKDKYIIDKESTAIPTFFMKVIGRVDDGEEPIYCFNVEKYNNFISQGVLCSNSIPSRMTMSQMLECMYSKACALGGTFGDSTAFSDTSIDPVEDISKKLQAFGFQKYGNERMYSGFTGEMLDAEIFIGPTYYQRLKHLVADKIHCLTTDHDVLTRNGWKPITEITLDDKVATLDKNGYLVYQEPKSIMNYPEYRGNMYYVETDNVDLAVTANHRMWVKDLSSASYDFKRADEVFNIPVYYKNNANWRELENSLTSVTKDKIIELVFELKLLKTDVVPEWIFTLNSGYVRMFLDTLNQFTSESKYIIDQLQQLLLHSGGWSGVVITNESAKTYTLLIDKSQKDPFVQGGDRLVENQKCHVVCLSVPNEIFYVRRNGKAVWTGNSRATGNVTMMHHQPSEGRSREGGLRVGEMERDALISHGGAAFIQETLFDMSDQYQINVCENCGNIVSSATACRMCKTGQINRTNIPYCAKLLFQELEAMGINIQINTKDEKKEEKKDEKKT
jgi:DNA-directed RNA polymerase beta subunit